MSEADEVGKLSQMKTGRDLFSSGGTCCSNSVLAGKLRFHLGICLLLISQKACGW